MPSSVKSPIDGAALEGREHLGGWCQASSGSRRDSRSAGERPPRSGRGGRHRHSPVQGWPHPSSHTSAADPPANDRGRSAPAGTTASVTSASLMPSSASRMRTAAAPACSGSTRSTRRERSSSPLGTAHSLSSQGGTWLKTVKGLVRLETCWKQAASRLVRAGVAATDSGQHPRSQLLEALIGAEQHGRFAAGQGQGLRLRWPSQRERFRRINSPGAGAKRCLLHRPAACIPQVVAVRSRRRSEGPSAPPGHDLPVASGPPPPGDAAPGGLVRG